MALMKELSDMFAKIGREQKPPEKPDETQLRFIVGGQEYKAVSVDFNEPKNLVSVKLIRGK